MPGLCAGGGGDDGEFVEACAGDVADGAACAGDVVGEAMTSLGGIAPAGQLRKDQVES